MRIVFLCVLLPLLTFAVRGVQIASAGEISNALSNPGFEDKDQQWLIADATSQIIAEAAHEGKMGLRVGTADYNPEGSSVTSARFPVQPGQDINLNFWARTKTHCSGVYLMFNKADGKPVSPVKGGPNLMSDVGKIDGNWDQYTLQAKAPADAASVAVWVHSFAGTRGTVDLDDVSLCGIAPGATPLPMPAPRKRNPIKNVSVADLPPRKAPPIIIIKLDDLKQVNGKVPPAWLRVAECLSSRKIKGSIGIICETLADATPEYTQWIKDRQNAGQIEFWFHAWDHAVHEDGGKSFNEFSHRTYEEQKKRFDDSQKLAREKFGFVFQTFGPPGGVFTGSLDENTIRVMQDDPDMKVWLYPQPIDEAGKKLEAMGKVTILDRVWEVNFEGAVGIPDCQRLINGYAQNPDREYFVLQGHAAAWTGDRFDEFVKIIDFLVSQKAVFMMPSEYVASKKK